MRGPVGWRAWLVVLLLLAVVQTARAAITLPLTGGSNTDPAMVASPRVDMAQFASSSSLVKAMADIHDRFATYLFDRAAKIGCEAAALAAVIYVESGGRGFSGSRMIIRFENHVFRPRLNNDALFYDHFTFNTDQSWTGHTWRPTTSDPWQIFHGDQNKEWTVLQFAQGLNDMAALQSASYGAPQIMGFNAQSIGYSDARAMFLSFSNSLENQMDGMISFIKGRANCLTGLRTNNFVLFASCYNGAGQAETYGANILGARNAYVTVLNTLGVVPPTPCQYGGLYGACGITNCAGETYAGVAECGAQSCCIDHIPCKPSGQQEGRCVDQSLCASPGQLFSGLCPGGATIRCCVGAPTKSPVTPPPVATASPTFPSCTYAGLSGQCSNSCTGSDVQGYADDECSGGSVCCVPTQSCSPAQGITGKCLDVSLCSGTTYTGFCPGNSSIRCCVAPTNAPSAATAAPTTKQPTMATMAPTTMAPTSKSPTSQSPTTLAPTTRAPTSKAPTSKAPTTLAPTSKAPTTKAPTASCTYEGLSGYCQAACAESDRRGYADPECPGGVCCVPAQACTPAPGLSGTCLAVSACSGTTFSGFCPGNNNIKCCVPTNAPTTPSPTPASCTYEGLPGTCRSQCPLGEQGYTDSECAGGTKCCAPAQPCSPPGGASGTCIDSSMCSGTVHTGLCPGTSKIRCCVQSLPAIQGASGTSITTVVAGTAVPIALIGLAAAAFIIRRRRGSTSNEADSGPARWSVAANHHGANPSAHNPLFENSLPSARDQPKPSV